MRIEIYRFGHYVNAVESKDELRQWLLDNLPYDKSDGSVPPTTTLDVCIAMAGRKHFTFKTDNGLKRIEKILDAVKIEDVAKEFVTLKKRGENYIFDCPICGAGAAAYISPKHQILKCFGCEETGNVIHFVMKAKKCTFAQAQKWLEKTYNIKK